MTNMTPTQDRRCCSSEVNIAEKCLQQGFPIFFIPIAQSETGGTLGGLDHPSDDMGVPRVLPH